LGSYHDSLGVHTYSFWENILQASRRFFGRASVVGALAVTGLLTLSAPAHAEGAVTGMPLPVIELKEKSSPATVPPTTAKPVVSAVTVPASGTNVSSSDRSSVDTSTDEETSSDDVSDSSDEVADSSLAFTGMNTSRFIGIGMVLTAIGMALLAFTDAFTRAERTVRSLLPNRLSGK
jgi:hypothetical protein